MQFPSLRVPGRAACLLAAAVLAAVAHAATLDDNVKAMQDTNAEAGAVQKTSPTCNRRRRRWPRSTNA